MGGSIFQAENIKFRKSEGKFLVVVGPGEGASDVKNVM